MAGSGDQVDITYIYCIESFWPILLSYCCYIKYPGADRTKHVDSSRELTAWQYIVATKLMKGHAP